MEQQGRLTKEHVCVNPEHTNWQSCSVTRQKLYQAGIMNLPGDPFLSTAPNEPSDEGGDKPANGLAHFLTHSFWTNNCCRCVITANDMVIVDAPESEFCDITLAQLENGIRKSIGVLEHYLYTGMRMRMEASQAATPPREP